MTTFVVENRSVTVPPEIDTLEAFRQWTQTADLPKTARVSFFRGQVVVDMSKEQIFSHNQVKNEIAYVLTGLAKRTKKGRFFPDGVYVTNSKADLSCQPDGVFVLGDSFDSGRVRLVEGVNEGFVELEGSPVLVVEVVSESSVEKDTEILPDLYWKAGVEEYWLVDARDAKPQFTISLRAAKGFVAAKKQAGWMKSRVLGESFRLTAGKDERGDPEFNLEIC